MKLIDADALVKKVCKISCNKDRNACPHINSCFETGCKTVIAIENAPAIEAEPVRRGYWVENYGTHKCSECGEISCCSGNYCPDCGAKMDEVRE